MTFEITLNLSVSINGRGSVHKKLLRPLVMVVAQVSKRENESRAFFFFTYFDQLSKTEYSCRSACKIYGFFLINKFVGLCHKNS